MPKSYAQKLSKLYRKAEEALTPKQVRKCLKKADELSSEYITNESSIPHNQRTIDGPSGG